MTHGQKEKSSFQYLMLAWAAMGRQEPFHPQSGGPAFDQSVPASDSYLNQIVSALLETQWFVSLSPRRPPLA